MDHHKLLAIIIAYNLLFHVSKSSASGPGRWQTLLNNTGVVAMHMSLTHDNTVIMFDRTSSGPSAHPLRRRFNGTRCKGTPPDLADPSCYAHSIIYDVARNKIRPLDVQTDTWCSSGSTLTNGTLLQTGGYGPGSRRVRYFSPCGINGRCNWKETGTRSSLLSDQRWYSSNLRLPDKNDRVIVLGGRNVFSYEFVPKRSNEKKSFNLPFLHKTYQRTQGGNNLYPIIHLSSDGNLFVFANRDSILFNYKKNKVVKNFPRIPGLGSRSHPSTGSSVILPLDHADGFRKVEVMICGGAADGAYRAARQGRFLKGKSSCGRMVITGNRHAWRMERMPGPRVMSTMIVLPTSGVLIINGVRNGCAGWNYASGPAFEPYLYDGRRFSVLRATRVARMYHSSAVLLPDGRVLVAGSNPNRNYTFGNVSHPTELRLQAFVPDYMDGRFDKARPRNVTVDRGYRSDHEIGVGFFLLGNETVVGDLVFTAYAPPFNTHSISMNQRMLRLRCKNVTRNESSGWWRAVLEVPKSPSVAPSGYYMLSVVNNGIPSESQWVKFVHA